MEKSSILIVDDAIEVISSLKRGLRNEPYHVFIAGSGEDALKLLENNPCKVILSDIKMPVMDGFELLSIVKREYPHMIRVVISGHSDVQLILKIVNEKGIDRYLLKPWSNAEVKATIKQCIEIYDLRKEVLELREKLRKAGIKQ